MSACCFGRLLLMSETSYALVLEMHDTHSRLLMIIASLLQISAVMDKFETQFEDLDVATGYYENATSSATAVGTPQDDVDKLMHMVADEAGVELGAEMKAPETGVPASKVAAEEEREEGLGERLRALRN